MIGCSGSPNPAARYRYSCAIIITVWQIRRVDQRDADFTHPFVPVLIAGGVDWYVQRARCPCPAGLEVALSVFR